MIFRLFSKITVDQNTECWNWTRFKNNKGYGYITHKGKCLKAHRVFFEEFNGKIKENYVIDHICKNRACCNPDHLRQVTRKQNTLENSNSLQAINAKKTHCIRNHEFNEKNTGLYLYKGNTKRYCKKCKKLKSAITLTNS